jgi:hypothetical protein
MDSSHVVYHIGVQWLGVVLKEWKGADRKTLTIFVTGLFLILSSVVCVGYGSLLLN